MMETKSSKTNMEEVYTAELTIKQTWTSISLEMDGEKATGVSVMASLNITTEDFIHLNWEYRSEYKAGFYQERDNHYGMTKLNMRPISCPNKMTGNYYADHTRHTYGSVVLIKKA